MIHATKHNNFIHITGDTFYFKDSIKEIKGYRWDAINKIWIVPNSAQTLEILNFIGADFCENLQKEFASMHHYDGTISLHLPIKATPYKHQVAAFNFALGLYQQSKGFALLADMGTGKTITTIALMGRLYLDGIINRVLIAAPKSILPVWQNELKKFADFEYIILDKPKKIVPEPDGNDESGNGNNKKKGSKSKSTKTKSQTSKIEISTQASKTETSNQVSKRETAKQVSLQDLAIQAGVKPPLEISILNYESIWRLEEEYKEFRPDFIVADESSKIKNPTAKQSKALHKLGNLSKFNIILSGTPITNSPLDVYSQYKFVNTDIFSESWWTFQERYAKKDHNHRIIGFKNLGQLLQRMHKVAYRVKLTSVVDMPPVVNLQRIVTLTPTQKKQYTTLQKGLLQLLQDPTSADGYTIYKETSNQMDMLAELDELSENDNQAKLDTESRVDTEVKQTSEQQAQAFEKNDNNTDSTQTLPQARYDISHDNVLTKLLKLAQFTGGFATDDDGTVHCTNKAKIDELDNLLEEFSNKKIVIFARFRAELQAITDLLKSKNIDYSLVYGDTKDRQNQVDRFQTLDNVRVFVGQIATAGMGITLTAAHTTIYYSLDFSYQNYEQSRSRTFRIGQNHPCTYIHLLVQDSIDQLMYNALLNKQDVAKQLVDDYKGIK